jgi:anti-anti-sigma factor
VRIPAQTHGRVTLLAPQGPLVGDELPDFRRAVESAAAARGGHVVVDLNQVPYLDSAGLELLLELCGAQAAGPASSRSGRARPKLAALSETCRDALELTDVLPQLEVFDTVENALRSCQR